MDQILLLMGDILIDMMYDGNREDDSQWPTKNVVGSQELEVRLGNEHISFEASIGWITRCIGESYTNIHI